MARRWLPIGLALLAAGLDAGGSHHAAFYLVLAAVPATAVAALSSLGELLDARVDDRAGAGLFLPPLLAGLAVLLLVSAAAMRAPALDDAALPALAANALTASLCVLSLEAIVAVFAEPRPARRPASLRAARLRTGGIDRSFQTDGRAEPVRPEVGTASGA